MTRRAVAFDRLVTLLLGLAVLSLGVAVYGWSRGAIGGGRALRPVAAGVVDAPWWPWVSASGGALLILLGLFWLSAHRRPRRASRVGLARAEAGLTADVAAVASAAATALGEQSAVLDAGGTAIIERGRPTLTLSATVPARHGLASGVGAADEVAATVATMIGDRVVVRTVLRTKTVKQPVVR